MKIWDVFENEFSESDPNLKFGKLRGKEESKETPWLEIRCGKVTGTKLTKLISPNNFKKLNGEGYKTQICEIATDEFCDIINESDTIRTKAMEDGHTGEEHARRAYIENLKLGLELTTPLFLQSDCDRYGFSPDGVITDDNGLFEGFIEVKTVNRGIYAKSIFNDFKELLLGNKRYYLMQIMMGFVVCSDFSYCDFIVNSINMKNECRYAIKRIERSEYEEQIQKVKEILEYEILPEIELVKQNFKKQFNLK